MSNDITLFSNVPAHLRNTELSDATKALMGGGGFGKRISIKGGTFRLLVGGKEVAQIEERNMDVIVVRAAPAVSRQFYKDKYDGENVAPPDCWSNDGEKPDPSVKSPQHKTCNGCPQNIAGSGQGESRACRFQQRLAVMLPDDMESGVYQLTLPATSIFGKAEGSKRPLKEYVTYLASQPKPVNVDALVTKMRFDTRVEHPKLFFEPVRWLDDAEYAAAREGGESAEAKAAVTQTAYKTDSKAEPVQIEGHRSDISEPKAQPAGDEADKPRAPRGRKPKVEVVADIQQDVAEPEKRKPGPKADQSVPVKTKLADVVSQWDDDE